MNNFKDILKSQKVNKHLMVVFPHPDDETVATGGLLLYANKYGFKTTVVTLTKGGAGKCYINKKGRTLEDIRTEELKSSVDILKVDNLIILNFRDSELRESTKEVKEKLKKIIVKENPSILITYDHSGFTGHPDHISLSLSVFDIVKEIKNKPVLYWVSILPLLSKFVFNSKTVKYYQKPTHVLNIGLYWILKLKATLKHKSQDVGSGNILLHLYLAIFHYEWYYKVDLNKMYKHKFVYFKI